MHIEYLKEFTTLARTLNFTEAAALENISQPALSKHILAIEREFGCDLFIRNKRSVRLTFEGKVFFENAIPLIYDYEKLSEEMSRALKNTIHIVISGAMRGGQIINLMERANDNYEAKTGVRKKLAFSQLDKDAYPFEQLVRDNADILLTYRPPSLDFVQTEVLSETVQRDPLVAIFEHDDSLAGRDVVNMSDLRDKTFIQMLGNSNVDAWAQIEHFCQRAGFSPRVRRVPVVNGADCYGIEVNRGVLILSESNLNLRVFEENSAYSISRIHDCSFDFGVFCLRKSKNRSAVDFYEEIKNLVDLDVS